MTLFAIQMCLASWILFIFDLNVCAIRVLFRNFFPGPVSVSLTYCLFYQTQGIRACFEVLGPFGVDFYVEWGCRCSSRCSPPSLTQFDSVSLRKDTEDSIFSQVWFWLLCHKWGVHGCVDLCLSLLFDSTDKHVWFYDNTALLLLLKLYIYCF